LLVDTPGAAVGRSSPTELHQVITPAELREAERTLKVMLGPKFPSLWIAEHAQEVLGQAHVEYQVWMESNGPARSPVGWLCTCAYRRALNIRDSERRRPILDPLDTVFHLPDEQTPTPEQEAIDRDRQEHLCAAMSHLPEKEIKLLALVYFDKNSIREAGRKLGWQKSAADRHHDTAMEKLRAQVGHLDL
jgi:RNA polymerase sigma factor (sigma-70 family)